MRSGKKSFLSGKVRNVVFEINVGRWKNFNIAEDAGRKELNSLIIEQVPFFFFYFFFMFIR